MYHTCNLTKLELPEVLGSGAVSQRSVYAEQPFPLTGSRDTETPSLASVPHSEPSAAW